MKAVVLAMVLGLAASANARLTDNQTDIKVEAEAINITTKPGFHLNAEAPASAVFDNLEALYKPTTKTEKLFVFKKLAKAKVANLSFYVCDDKKTVCEQQQQSINLKSGDVKKAEVKTNFTSTKEVNLASKDGRPTLLIFSAPWCPACVRMQTEVYHQPAVEKQLAKLNFVKVNSDVADNSELADKFKIKAIPTLILLDKNGNETYRWLDYQPVKSFAAGLNTELKKVDQAAALVKNAQMGDVKAASELGHRAFNTLDYAEAFKWFSMTKTTEDQKYKLSSEVSLAGEKAEADEKLNADYVQTLQKAIVMTTSQLDQIRWTLDLLSKKKEMNAFEGQAKAKETIVKIEKLAANKTEAEKLFKQSTYGEYGGFEQAELLWMDAKFYDLLDMKEAKANVDQKSITLLNQKKLSVKRPGEMLMGIGYLKEAGETKKVEGYYNDLIAAYPATYVYYEKYARFAKKNKENEKALKLTEEALKFPEGNQPQLSLLKTQILKDLNRNAEALTIIDQTLKTEGIEHKKFKGTVAKLTEIKAELAKTK